MAGEAIRVLKRNMRRRSVVSGLFRTDEWEYPEEVLREAIVNALVHRDFSEYARGMQVQVELYPDRLVVRNPGGLYGPVEITSLGTSIVSSSRNRVLLKILEDTALGDGHMVCENRGTSASLHEFRLKGPCYLCGLAFG
jgi:ATP-dependent DNA helicase RecG